MASYTDGIEEAAVEIVEGEILKDLRSEIKTLERKKTVYTYLHTICNFVAMIGVVVLGGIGTGSVSLVMSKILSGFTIGVAVLNAMVVWSIRELGSIDNRLKERTSSLGIKPKWLSRPKRSSNR